MFSTKKNKTWKIKIKKFLDKNIRNGTYIGFTDSARRYDRFQMFSSSSELTLPGPWNPHVSDYVSRSDAERIEILPKMQRPQEDNPPITMWIIWRHGLECWLLGPWLNFFGSREPQYFILSPDMYNCGFCSNRIPLYFPLSVRRPCVCMSVVTGVTSHISHILIQLRDYRSPSQST